MGFGVKNQYSILEFKLNITQIGFRFMVLRKPI
jgi:hypothetical protein